MYVVDVPNLLFMNNILQFCSRSTIKVKKCFVINISVEGAPTTLISKYGNGKSSSIEVAKYVTGVATCKQCLLQHS